MRDHVERVTREVPCVICGSHPDLPRGDKVRCWGGRSAEHAYCTRSDYAGALELHDSLAYRHRIRCRCADGCTCAERGRRAPGCWCAERCGCCRCGVEHERAIQRPSVTTKTIPTPTERSEIARRIWRREAGAAPGTIVEHYLRGRGITLPVPPTLRYAMLWHAPSRRHLPAMVASVQSATGDVVAVHRTFVEPSSVTRIDKMMLGPTRGAGVRLAAAGDELAIAEGIESGLAYQQMTGRPTWATLSAPGLRAIELPPLPIAARIVIAADHDPVGLEAAGALARRLYLEGRRVRIAKPPREGADFNDVLRGAA